MIGVVVPAHDEALSIGACLRAIRAAGKTPLLGGEKVKVVVVLDACTDATGVVARAFGAVTVSVLACNVGLARAAGAQYCLEAGARWLCFTDADTVVSQNWISSQLLQNSDVVCGTVSVDDWGDYGTDLRHLYEKNYKDADGHRHIHGANLGMCAKAYQRAGGFAPLVTGEDVALVGALQASGASIKWSAAPRVVTSARKDYRAPRGFGALLQRLEAALERPRSC